MLCFGKYNWQIFPSITNSKAFKYVSHKMSFISPTIPSTSVLQGFLTNLQSNYFIENHLWCFLLTFSQKFYWSVIKIIKAYGDVDTISFWSAIIDQNLTLLAKYTQYLIEETTQSFCTCQMYEWWVAWHGDFKLFFSRTHLNGSYVVRHSMS